jgi:type I restriction enzyme M protein
LPRPGRGETIEALFVRRFVALARPGGWLAVVVPEGIVASDRAQRLRDWLQERVALKAIVALPEATFSRSGTAAHTALLLARKAARVSDAEVLLASPPDNCRGEAGLARYLSEVLARIRHR